MFHHNDRIAHIAQIFKRSNQFLVVALVQPDARLVENVKHIHQLRPDLRSQANALTFAARQRSRSTVERQVAQPHIEQKLQARVYLFQNFGGDGQLFFRHRFGSIAQPSVQVAQFHSRQFGDIFARYAVVQGFAIEACAVAFGTLHRCKKLVCPLLLRRRYFGHLLLHFDVMHNAFVGGEVVGVVAERRIFHLYALFAAVQNLVQRLVGNVGNRRFQRKAISFGNRF